MDNLVYQIPHKAMQELINYLGNTFNWVQAEPALRLIRENIKEINLDIPANDNIPAVEGK